MAGRNWAKAKRRSSAAAAIRELYEDEALLRDPPEQRQSKDDIRAETEALVAAFRGKVKVLPMHVALRCRSCGHRGTACVPSGKPAPGFRCSRCGSTLVKWMT